MDQVPTSIRYYARTVHMNVNKTQTNHGMVGKVQASSQKKTFVLNSGLVALFCNMDVYPT